MAELASYVEILQDGLKEKITILTNIIELNSKQEELLKEDVFDVDAFDNIVDKKQKLIGSLNKLDDGFEATYDRIRVEFTERKEEFKRELSSMKADIAVVMDCSMTIQASEARNKEKIESYFRNERKIINSKRVSKKAALDYYKANSRVNYYEPVVLDKRK